MKPCLNKSLLIITLLLTSNLFFSSCHKDNNDPETAPVPLLASYTRFDNKGILYYSESYQYDKKNRLSRLTYHDGYIMTFEYSGSTVIEKGYDDHGLEGTAVGQLNKQGLCISLSSGDYYNTKFEYDNDGYCKSIVNTSPSSIQTSNFIVSEGNYVTSTYEEKSKTTNSAHTKEIVHFKSAFIPSNLSNRFAPENRLRSAALNPSSTTEYQFYTDKVNTIGYANTGTSFYGKGNKNPIKRQFTTYYDEVTGTLTYDIFNSTYEYDTKGRMTKQLFDNGSYYVFTYID